MLVIKDLIHLPIDLVVLKNIQLKKNLQALTMGELQSQLDEAEKEIKDDLISL